MRLLTISKALVRRKTDGKYLLLTSSKWEERPDRSQKPDLPGGMVENNENSLQGCVREVQEESGIIVSEDDLQLIYASTFHSSRDDASITRLIYLVEVDNPSVTISWEHESYDWVTANDLLNCEIREPYPEIFNYLNSADILK